jgi:excisionase family DNA binding protein
MRPGIDHQEPLDVLLETNLVAEVFGITPWELRRKCRDKEIEAVKIGRHWRIRRSVVEKVLAGGVS